MKRTKILLLTTAAAAGMLFAQGFAGQGPGAQGFGLRQGPRAQGLAKPQRPGMQRLAGLGPRLQRQQRLLDNYLGLTPEQIAKRGEINQAAAEQARPIREELNRVRTQLQEAIHGLQPVDALAAQVGTLTGQLTAIRAKARQDFLRLLTPEQLQKLESLRNSPPPRPPRPAVQQ